jgi:hypothetical protein
VSTVPAYLHGLVADAPTAPPAGTAGHGTDRWLVEALTADRRLTVPELLGPFVVDDRTLAGLERAVGTAVRDGVADLDDPLHVGLVVTGGAGALGPAARRAESGSLSLDTLHTSLRDPDDVVGNARRVVAAVDAALDAGDLDDGVGVHVALPAPDRTGASRDWLAALDVLAARDLGVTFAPAELGAAGLATCLGAALDRELRFTCAGGSPRAVTGTAGVGFLDVLVATRTCLDGAAAADVAAVLQETDPARLLAHADGTGLASARRWFTSTASSDLAASVADLRDLGLVA